MHRSWTFLAAATGLAAPASPSGEPSPVPPWHVREGVHFRSFALEANPLGVAIGRFGANLEALPLRHHAMLVSLHAVFARPGENATLEGGGAEAGYRYYAGEDGPEGLFLGVADLAGQYRYQHRTGVPPSATWCIPRCALPDDTTYQSFGGAVDVGWAFLFDHAVGSVGLGFQYQLFTSQPGYEQGSREWVDRVYGSGIRPRILASIGAAL